jgi:GH25 family lysozyme M1 (1,4-beta-N-acetylmuramidase)
MAVNTYYGLDTSRWNGKITQPDINAAKAAGKVFWYLKGSGGDDGLYVDSEFANTLALLRTTNFKRGVYHFAGLGSNPQSEARFVVSKVWGKLNPKEVAILDIDTFGPSDPVWAQEFLTVATSLLGFKPLLYMNQATENNANWSTIVKSGYGLIIANYAVSPAGTVHLEHWPFYFGQQYSSNGTVGSLHPVDLDAIFATSLDAWDRYAKPSPVTVPAPTPAPKVSPISPPAPKANPTPQPTPVPAPSPTPVPPITTTALPPTNGTNGNGTNVDGVKPPVTTVPPIETTPIPPVEEPESPIVNTPASGSIPDPITAPTPPSEPTMSEAQVNGIIDTIHNSLDTWFGGASNPVTVKDHLTDVLVRAGKTFIETWFAIILSSGFNWVHINSNKDILLSATAAAISAAINTGQKVYKNLY